MFSFKIGKKWPSGSKQKYLCIFFLISCLYIYIRLGKCLTYQVKKYLFKKGCIVPVLGKVLEVYWIVFQSFSESSWSNQRIRCAKIDQTVNLIWASYRCSKCAESTISLHPLSLGTKLNTYLVPRWVSTGLAQTIVNNCQFSFPSVLFVTYTGRKGCRF